MKRDYPDMIARLAGPMGLYPNRERWLATAAERAGISYRMAKSLFGKECTDPKTSVTDKIEAALRSAGESMNKAAESDIARLEQQIQDLRAQMHRMVSGCYGPADLDRGRDLPRH